MRAHRVGAVALLWLAFAALPATANAAIAFVAASSGATSGGGATTLALTKPAGVASGQVMLATITATGTDALTPPQWLDGNSEHHAGDGAAPGDLLPGRGRERTGQLQLGTR